MQREWRDPRDGTLWLVTVSPLGSSRATPRRITIVFHLRGSPPHWTEYPLDKPLPEAGDSELIDLLEAARRRDRSRSGPVRNRRSPA